MRGKRRLRLGYAVIECPRCRKVFDVPFEGDVAPATVDHRCVCPIRDCPGHVGPHGGLWA